MAIKAVAAAQKRDHELYGASLDSVLKTAAPRAREIAASYSHDEIALFSIVELLWPTLIQSIWCLVPNGGIIKRDDYQWLEILAGYFAVRHGYDSRQFWLLSDRECIDVLLADMFAAEAGKRFKCKCNPESPELVEGYLTFKGKPWRLTESEEKTLKALIRYRAASKEELINESSVSNPPAVLKRLRKKWRWIRPYITMPGGKGNGGYRTAIQ